MNPAYLRGISLSDVLTDLIHQTSRRQNEILQNYGQFTGPSDNPGEHAYHEHSVTRRHVKNQPTFPDHFIDRQVLLIDGTLLNYTGPDFASTVNAGIKFAITKRQFDEPIGRWYSESGLEVWGCCRHDLQAGTRLYSLILTHADDTEPTRDEINDVLRTFTPYTATLELHGEVIVHLGERNVPTYHLIFSL